MMPDDKLRQYREIGPYLGLGVQLAATIVIMVYLGNWLDEKFGKKPLFTLICAALGIISGMYNLIKTVLDIEKRMKQK